MRERERERERISQSFSVLQVPLFASEGVTEPKDSLSCNGLCYPGIGKVGYDIGTTRDFYLDSEEEIDNRLSLFHVFSLFVT